MPINPIGLAQNLTRTFHAGAGISKLMGDHGDKVAAGALLTALLAEGGYLAYHTLGKNKPKEPLQGTVNAGPIWEPEDDRLVVDPGTLEMLTGKTAKEEGLLHTVGDGIDKATTTLLGPVADTIEPFMPGAIPATAAAARVRLKRKGIDKDDMPWVLRNPGAMAVLPTALGFIGGGLVAPYVQGWMPDMGNVPWTNKSLSDALVSTFLPVTTGTLAEVATDHLYVRPKLDAYLKSHGMQDKTASEEPMEKKALYGQLLFAPFAAMSAMDLGRNVVDFGEALGEGDIKRAGKDVLWGGMNAAGVLTGAGAVKAGTQLLGRAAVRKAAVSGGANAKKMEGALGQIGQEYNTANEFKTLAQVNTERRAAHAAKQKALREAHEKAQALAQEEEAAKNSGQFTPTPFKEKAYKDMKNLSEESVWGRTRKGWHDFMETVWSKPTHAVGVGMEKGLSKIIPKSWADHFAAYSNLGDLGKGSRVARWSNKLNDIGMNPWMIGASMGPIPLGFFPSMANPADQVVDPRYAAGVDAADMGVDMARMMAMGREYGTEMQHLNHGLHMAREII